MNPDLVKRIKEIARETGETKTYVVESLIEFGIKAHEKDINTEDE